MSGRRVVLVAAFMLSAAMILTATPARAHKGPSIVLPAPIVAPAAPVASPAEPISSSAATISNGVASPAAPSFGWLALLAAVAVLATASRRPRSAGAFAFALLLGIFAFERGVHSVHHLGQPVQAHECAVAAAASHTEAAADHGSSLLVAGLAPAGAAAEVSSPRLTPFCLSAKHGRAPPAPLA
jgi:hypothetical protein